MNKKILTQVKNISDTEKNHKNKATKIAELLCSSKSYRWVGLYDVTEKDVINVAWFGHSAPAYPVFPITKGLTSSAIFTKETVNVGNVNADNRYLTALGDTQSEIIIPLILEGKIIGTLDVESENLNAFSKEEQEFLEQCAEIISKEWKN